MSKDQINIKNTFRKFKKNGIVFSVPDLYAELPHINHKILKHAVYNERRSHHLSSVGSFYKHPTFVHRYYAFN